MIIMILSCLKYTRILVRIKEVECILIDDKDNECNNKIDNNIVLPLNQVIIKLSNNDGMNDENLNLKRIWNWNWKQKWQKYEYSRK